MTPVGPGHRVSHRHAPDGGRRARRGRVPGAHRGARARPRRTVRARLVGRAHLAPGRGRAIRVAHVAVDQVGGRIPVYVGVGDTGLDPDARPGRATRRRRRRLRRRHAALLLPGDGGVAAGVSTSRPSPSGWPCPWCSTTSRRTRTCPCRPRAVAHPGGTSQHRGHQGLRGGPVRIRGVPGRSVGWLQRAPGSRAAGGQLRSGRAPTA